MRLGEFSLSSGCRYLVSTAPC